ncbi:hypothetical protein N7497_007108 [Penicillium chrysogenum]|nr:hypothetical protein N7524_002598 [Penicillium chrysogenum]KAJ6152789.1 hypothetical protein N7497_007108 [Penicillium chrysogenum]
MGFHVPKLQNIQESLEDNPSSFVLTTIYPSPQAQSAKPLYQTPTDSQVLILTHQIRPRKTRPERENPQTTTMGPLVYLNNKHIQRRLAYAALIQSRSINTTAGIGRQFH